MNQIGDVYGNLSACEHALQEANKVNRDMQDKVGKLRVSWDAFCRDQEWESDGGYREDCDCRWCCHERALQALEK